MLGLRWFRDRSHLTGVTAIRAQTPEQTMLVELDPQQAFHAVIHIRRITPAHGAADQDHPDSNPET